MCSKQKCASCWRWDRISADIENWVEHYHTSSLSSTVKSNESEDRYRIFYYLLLKKYPYLMKVGKCITYILDLLSLIDPIKGWGMLTINAVVTLEKNVWKKLHSDSVYPPLTLFSGIQYRIVMFPTVIITWLALYQIMK